MLLLIIAVVCLIPVAYLAYDDGCEREQDRQRKEQYAQDQIEQKKWDNYWSERMTLNNNTKHNKDI